MTAFGAAADRGPGHDRRLQADHRGPRQPRPGRARSGSATRSSPGATGRRGCRACSTAPGPTRRGCTSTSTGPSAWPWACRSATSSTRCRSTSARYYVNNFNEFGRTWQVNVQADPRFRDRVRDIRQLQVRNNQGQMVRAGHAAGRARHQRPGHGHALQHVLGRRHHRQRRRRAPAPARRSR